MIEPKFKLELTGNQAIVLRLALHRALHFLFKMVAEYTELTKKDAGFAPTLTKYKADLEEVRVLLKLSRESWDALQDEKLA